MKWAHDVLGVSAPLQHDGLTMATNVGQQGHRVTIIHQNLSMIAPRQGKIIACTDHHEFVTHILGGFQKQTFSLHRFEGGVGVPAQW